MNNELWALYDGEELINTIVGEESFVKDYAGQNGWRYKKIIVPEPQEPPDMPQPDILTDDEIKTIKGFAAALKGVGQ